MPPPSEPNCYEIHALLVQRVAAGEDEAAVEVYGLVMIHLGKIKKQLGSQDAEDLVHEIFADVLTAIQKRTIREPGRLVGFIAKIVFTKIAERIKQKEKDRLYLADLSHVRKRRENDVDCSRIIVESNGCDLNRFLASNDPDPETVAIQRDLDDHATAALQCLQPRDRHVMERVYRHADPLSEVAKTLGVKRTLIHKVKSRAQRRYVHHRNRIVGAPRRKILARLNPAVFENSNEIACMQ